MAEKIRTRGPDQSMPNRRIPDKSTLEREVAAATTLPDIGP